MPLKGFKHSEESKMKIRLANLGKKLSPETIEKMRQRKLGEKHPAWKGDKVRYSALHEWVRNHLPKPELCSMCAKKEALEVSNISRKYLRDLDDYRWLCKSCHRKYEWIIRKRKLIK